MNKKVLKIYIYNQNGEKIKEDKYSNLIWFLNEVVDHNLVYEEDKWNIIYGFEFPPYYLKWDNEEKDWIENKGKNLLDKKNFFVSKIIHE